MQAFTKKQHKLFFKQYYSDCPINPTKKKLDGSKAYCTLLAAKKSGPE